MSGAESAAEEERKRFVDTRTFVEDAENAEAHGAAESNAAISSREKRFICFVRSGDMYVATVP